MTNQQRQASLDKQKWLESETMGIDMSGCMLYCYHCEHQTDDGFVDWCMIPHEERVEKCLCATAYNRMVRGTKRNEL